MTTAAPPTFVAPELRPNGLGAPPVNPGRVLVAGGGGYIGSVLCRKLLERGYEVRIYDRLWWGQEPLLDIIDDVEIVVGDVRDIPQEVMTGLDGVINLSGLSNDPTAEYDPEANWQMNAIATENMGRACLNHDVERLVFASSCSLYDGLPIGMHDETAAVVPRAAYATSKHYGEQALQRLVPDGLCPAILRNGTVYGASPRMRFDLVVNTFVKDALLRGKLSLHGGGWMWRPLVDIQDVADALICVLEAPSAKVRGEVFNVLHSNYQIRELAMLVAGSVQVQTGKLVELEELPAPVLTRNYECSNAKLADQLGFLPSRSVLHAVTDMLLRYQDADPATLTDPRNYNLRWLELLKETKPIVETAPAVL